MSMKNYIGTVLAYDEGSSIATINKFRPILRAVDELGEAYEDLDTSFKFSQDIFQDILANDIKNISLTYAQVIENQIKSSKFTSKAIVASMLENIPKELSNLSLKVKTLREVHQRTNSGLSSLPVDMEFIRIENGKAVLNEQSQEAIREIFTIKVRDDQQNQLYNLLLNLKEHYENLTSFLNDSGINLDRWGDLISDRGNGLCYELNGKLIIDASALTIKLKKHGRKKEQFLDTQNETR